MEKVLLNLLGVVCPINFVRTKLRLDSLNNGEMLEVLLDDGEPIESVSKSVLEEGHTILSKQQLENKSWCLTIEKNCRSNYLLC